MEAEQFAPGRLHLLTGHDYTRRFVNHATHIATRPSMIHPKDSTCDQLSLSLLACMRLGTQRGF